MPKTSSMAGKQVVFGSLAEQVFHEASWSCAPQGYEFHLSQYLENSGIR